MSLVRVFIISIFLTPTLSAIAAAQSFVLDAGIRVGGFAGPPPVEAPSNHYFPPSYSVDRTIFSVGPSISALLYNRVEVRFEAVRSTFHFDGRYQAGPTSGTSTTRGYLWQFPLLATYAFGSGTSRPFAGG